jgi:peptidoglycan/xylan/chitin deacetylase (PgdA/CDA1 family)
MYRFHATPFDDIMYQMFDVLDKYNSRFTFPLTASSGSHHPDMVEILKSSGNEIAIHGFKHIRYDFNTPQTQKNDLELAIKTFNELKVPYKGHRTPYNQYTSYTERLVEQKGFTWDGGIGYRKENQERTEMFKHILPNGKESSFVCIPLSIWSDDYMIDYLNFNPRQIAQKLIQTTKRAKEHQGVAMFDLHPVRIGQKNYLASVEATLDFCRKNDIWVPNVSEAVEYWWKHKKWKGDTNGCCLLTGDIDNFTFWDYLRRF